MKNIAKKSVHPPSTICWFACCVCSVVVVFGWVSGVFAGDELTVTIGEEQAADEQATSHTPAESAVETKAKSVDLSAVDLKAATVAETNPPATTADVGAESNPATESEGPAKPGPYFKILNTKVAPGTAQRLAWSPEVAFAGIAVPTPVLIVNGAQPGPVVCLTAAIHGDELNGIEVVRRAMFDLVPEDLTGTVIGVPIVNLQGFRRSSRYLPDRRDLNRYFPGRKSGSSASRIAYTFFNQVIKKCDLLVDLHTGSFQRTNLPQLRADLTNPAVAELSKKMGSIVVMQSKGARGSLRRAASEAGVPAVTLEAGEPHSVQLEAVEYGVRSIESLLHKMGMYKQRGFWARGTEPVYYKSRWVRAPSGGVLISKIVLGERVKEGQLLGQVTDPITNFQQDIVSPIKGRVIGMALNQVMMPGFAAYHIGYQATVEEAAELDAGPDEASGDEAEMENGLGEEPDKANADSPAQTPTEDKGDLLEPTELEQDEIEEDD